MPDPKELTIDKSAPLRKFDVASINKQIDEQMSSLRSTDHGAVIAVIDPDKAFHLAYVHRVQLQHGELDWTVMVSKPWDEPFSPELKIRYRF